MSNEQRAKQDAEYQRRRSMTREELARDAIDRGVERIKRADEMSGGQRTESDIRSYMTRIAEKAERTKSENDGRKPR